MIGSWEHVQEAASAIRARVPFRPEIGIVLGTGLGALADHVERAGSVSYAEIPHFPRPTVEGHAGELVLGQIEGKPAAVLRGRAHLYEGYTPQEVVFPVRVLYALGCRLLVVTNAAGGLNREWRAGDLMVISDHINLQGTNPLLGPNDERLGPRFPDMSRAYDPELVALAERCALEERIPLRRGVYVAVLGPSYETPAELRMLRLLVIAARHLGMRVLGLSAITDMATGEVVQPVTHEEVLRVARELEPRFVRLVRRILRELRCG